MAVPERFSHSRSLFITDLGPMRFYVRPGPLKRQLSPLITYGGGIMCRVQEPGAFLLADPGQSHGIQYMSSSYITDCVSSNRKLSPQGYRLLNQRAAGPGQSTMGLPERRHRRTLSPEEPLREPGAEQSHSTGGPRENLHDNVCPSGAPASFDPGLNPGAPASCDPGLNPGAPASCDPGLNPGAPASCDPGLNPGAPASCDPGLNPGAPASCDPGLNPGAPASCDPGLNPGAPASCDSGLNPGAPASCEPGLNHGAPASCDPGQTVGASAKKDLGAEHMESRGHVDDRIGLGTHRGCRATEDHQAKCSKVSQQWTVPSQGELGPVGRVRFSRQEDLAILQYVQENEGPKKSATGNLLWMELEKKQLVQRTWQAMKYRYKKYIVPHKHRYKLPLRTPAPSETPRTSAIHPRDPISAGANIDLTAQHHDPLFAGISLSSASPPAAGSGGDREGTLCTDLSTDGGSAQGGNTITQPKSKRGKGKKLSASINKQRRRSEDPDSDHSEELHIFEIANMEFELDGEGPAVSLTDFVMGEDSLSMPGDDSEGLQDALTSLMCEFSLDVSQVIQALLKNNGEVGSTRYFLRVGQRPDGFPVWEYKDDLVLQKNDPMLQVQLEKKYGADNVAKRLAFLAS